MLKIWAVRKQNNSDTILLFLIVFPVIWCEWRYDQTRRWRFTLHEHHSAARLTKNGQEQTSVQKSQTVKFELDFFTYLKQLIRFDKSAKTSSQS